MEDRTENFYGLLRRQAKRHPQQLFLRADGERYTYAAFLAQVDRLAERVPAEASGSVLVAADGFSRQLAAFFALQKRGIRPILLHRGLPEAEVRAILRENGLQGLWRPEEASYRAASGSRAAGGYVPGEADVLGVLSSGSTGTPKAMYRTYESWAGFFPQQNEIFGVGEGTRLFLQGSLSFTGNLNAALAALYAGAALVTADGLRCRAWAHLMREERVDALYLVPTKLRLLAQGGEAPFPGVRSVFTGSQTLGPGDIRRLKALFPAARLVLYYGASELNYITYAVCEDEGRDAANLGRPFPGVAVTVRDGFIYVDTPYHVSGISVPFTVQDMGRLNAAGELLFAGRREGWANRGGVKLHALPIEQALKELPGVADAAALRYEEARRGQDIAAFVACPRAKRREVRRLLRERLSPLERPGRLIFLDALPLNDRGKADAGALRRLLEKNPKKLLF